MAVTLADDFNRADGGLGANWTAELGTLAISTNRVRGTSGSVVYSAMTGSIASAAQYVQFTVPTYANTSQEVYALLRWTTGVGNGYFFAFDGGTCTSQKMVTYGATTVDTTAFALAAGDLVRIEARGSTFRLYRNGVLTITFTDATYSSSGSAGLGCKAVTSAANVELDNFEAGTLDGNFMLMGCG